VQPSTREIKPKNLDEGKVSWFKWDAINGTLQNCGLRHHAKCKCRLEHDPTCECCVKHDPECEPPSKEPIERRCTTTVLYCEKDGFSCIPYHPFRSEREDYAYWWSLGFNTENRDVFTIERDDKSFDKKKIPGNASGWFKLFRDTDHDNSPVVVNQDTPLLTGATSLIWALAAFQFNIGNLAEWLPHALKRGKLHVLCRDQECPPGSMGPHLHKDVYRLTLLSVSRNVTTCLSRGALGAKG